MYSRRETNLHPFSLQNKENTSANTCLNGSSRTRMTGKLSLEEIYSPAGSLSVSVANGTKLKCQTMNKHCYIPYKCLL